PPPCSRCPFVRDAATRALRRPAHGAPPASTSGAVAHVAVTSPYPAARQARIAAPVRPALAPSGEISIGGANRHARAAWVATRTRLTRSPPAPVRPPASTTRAGSSSSVLDASASPSALVPSSQTRAARSSLPSASTTSTAVADGAPPAAAYRRAIP